MEPSNSGETSQSFENISVQADTQVQSISEIRSRTMSLKDELKILEDQIQRQKEVQKTYEGDINIMNYRNNQLENNIVEICKNSEQVVSSAKSLAENISTLREEDRQKRNAYDMKIREILNESRSAPTNFNVDNLKSRIDEIKMEYEEIQHDLESVQSELSLLKEKYKPDQNFSDLDLASAQNLLKTIITENRREIAENETKAQESTKSINSLTRKAIELEAEIAEKEKELGNANYLNE